MLEEYTRKRRFDKTTEPAADPFEFSEGPLRFVIQKHAATTLHYDFRIEAEGALKSWAVPKGPSLNPSDRRLAVMVEDHPLSYGGFEGSIPKGEYGGGEVIVWDNGTYEPNDKKGASRAAQESAVLEGLRKGKLSIFLTGKKLRGEWTLVRQDSTKNWFLIKKDDAYASDKDITTEAESVLSGRTVEDVRAGKEAKPAPKGRKKRDPENEARPTIAGAKKAATPEFMAPMVPTEVAKPFSHPDWSFELKLDGIRAIAIKNGSKVRLLSRNGRDIGNKFPALVEEIRSLTVESAVLDGEIVVFDDRGRPSFQGIIQRFSLQHEREIRAWDASGQVDFLLFDLLHLNGVDLRGASFENRRKALDEFNPRTRSIRVLDVYPEDGELLYDQAAKLGLEGIVGKRLSSTYRDGTRTRDWVKVKGYHTEEFLICGYTEGQGARQSTFGALVLGRMEADGMRFCGSVGGGFSDLQLVEIRAMLDALPKTKNPFKTAPDTKSKPVFVEPSLIAEVRFMAWTKDRILRFPIFKRLRPDLTVPATIQATSQVPNGEVEAVLDQLMGDQDELQLTVDGNPLRLSSLNKPLWPASDFTPPITKRDLIAYYARMSEAILPHLRDRPLAFVRFPDGIEGESFFQKHWDKGRPEYVDTVNIYSSHNGRSRDWLMCNNLSTLLWLGQMAALEIHPWYSRATTEPDAHGMSADFGSSEDALDESVLNYPDFVVFDLDPVLKNPTTAFDLDTYKRTADVAMHLKELLDGLRLRSYVKTSGKTGLHIYVPIQRIHTYEETRLIAETIGRHLLALRPKDVTMEWTVSKRPTSKIFFDHNQNVRGKTLASVYSLRPVLGAPASFPLRWDEVLTSHAPEFNIYTAPTMLVERGERWAELLRDRQRLELG